MGHAIILFLNLRIEKVLLLPQEGMEIIYFSKNIMLFSIWRMWMFYFFVLRDVFIFSFPKF